MAEHTIKRKVTVRPVSPLKSIQPTSRPKAKVNGSAQVRQTAPSRPGTSEGPTPRAVSPAKFVSSRPLSPTKHPTPRVKSTDSLSPTFQPKLRVTPAVRTNHTVSTPTTPESRSRAHTSASSDVGRISTQQRIRHGSVSLHHAVSFSSLIPPARSSSPLNQSDTEHIRRYSPSPSVRIKSKVTSLAKLPSPSPGSLSPTSTSHPAPPPIRSHRRVASNSSSISHATSAPNLPSKSQQSPPNLYPITTASPAANPHRYITRSPPQARSHQSHQSFQSESPVPVRQKNVFGGLHKPEEPPAAPLPSPNPNSPPTSALSFSSRSSVSRSPVSTSLTAGSNESFHVSAIISPKTRSNSISLHGNNQVPESTPPKPQDDDASVEKEQIQDSDSNGDGGGESRTVKAEAKSNRKIADLEITNRSLLAINASLESAKHRQAKEIRELRRKLRESRLILPPRAYRAVIEQKETSDGTLFDVASASEDGDDDGDGEGDETYERVKGLLEGLLESGKRALERKPAHLVEGGAKVTVLSADEVRSWQGSSEQATEDVRKEEVALSPSLVALPDDRSDSTFDSEDEVEQSLILPPSPSLTCAPPILVTDSH